MAGGKGKRLGMGEKPLLDIFGTPMIKRIIDSVREANLGKIYVSITENTPRTAKFLENEDVEIVLTSGTGYVEDMREVIFKKHISRAVLVLSSDLPLINSEILNEVVNTFKKSEKPALAVYVTRKFCRKYGITKKEDLSPTGINIVSGDLILRYPEEMQEEEVLILDRIEAALNVNTRKDLDILEKLKG